MISSIKSDRIVLVLILVLATLMRFYEYAAFSFFNDELSALTRLRFDNFSDLISQGVRIDGHPAGVQVFLYYWVKIFGWSEASVRFPFVLAGVISLFLFYRLAKMWFGPNTAILSLAVFCFLEYTILYSRIARPYSPGLMFSLLMLNGWTSYLFGSSWLQRTYALHKFLGLPLFTLSAIACMYLHYFSFLFMVIVALCGLFYVGKEKLKSYLLAGIVIILAALPHAEIFLFQFSVGGVGGPDGWLGVPKADALWSHLYYAFNESFLVIVLIAVSLFYSIYAYGDQIKWNKFHSFSLLFFILPFFIAYIYSVRINPVLQNSVLLFSFPCLLLFLFSFYPVQVNRTLLITFAGVLSIATMGSTIKEKQFYSKEHFGVFKELAEAMQLKGEQLGFDNITYSVNVNGNFYIDYYLDKVDKDKRIKVSNYKVNEETHVVTFQKMLEVSTTKYFMHSWSNIYNPFELDRMIRSRYPFVADFGKHFNSAWVLYSNDSSDQKYNVQRVRFFDSFDQPFTIDALLIQKEMDNSFVQLDGVEYGPTLNIPCNNLFDHDTTYISVNLKAKMESKASELLVVFSIEKDGQSLFWRGVDVSERVNKTDSFSSIYAATELRGKYDSDAVLKVFVWNKAKQQISIDDFEVEIYPPY
ncbi:MAG TPA: glycosyltransferase family 39 protein [Bacteroidia bacterium]|nr:glycosyltransferase family 39 protein [Bacteroidia bacterium]HNT79958.1 glycosyltransferase family 39 protein [Bacteroidia bacterium]